MSTSTADVPRAETAPKRRWSLAWLAPIAALVVAGFLVYDAMADRGPVITITFADGHDLKPNDPISHRGVVAGRVREVRLGPGLREVVVTAALTRDAAGLARDGAQFWVVRPEISLTRISGVETLLGPRYIAVRPGEGPPRRRFAGLENPPAERGLSGDGLVVVLEAPRAGSLQAGSPVLYRDVTVGSVTDTRLSADAAFVEVIVEILPEYSRLVRENSRFWNAGNIGVDLGFGGLTFQADSLSAILTGGVAFATPTKPGEAVANGARFQLADRPEEAWLKWSPALAAE